jgi:hypothetical protein
MECGGRRVATVQGLAFMILWRIGEAEVEEPAVRCPRGHLCRRFPFDERRVKLHIDGNKSLYLVFVRVVFFSISWTVFRAVRTAASWLFFLV